MHHGPQSHRRSLARTVAGSGGGPSRGVEQALRRTHLTVRASENRNSRESDGRLPRRSEPRQRSQGATTVVPSLVTETVPVTRLRQQQPYDRRAFDIAYRVQFVQRLPKLSERRGDVEPHRVHVSRHPPGARCQVPISAPLGSRTKRLESSKHRIVLAAVDFAPRGVELGERGNGFATRRGELHARVFEVFRRQLQLASAERLTAVAVRRQSLREAPQVAANNRRADRRDGIDEKPILLRAKDGICRRAQFAFTTTPFSFAPGENSRRPVLHE